MIKIDVRTKAEFDSNPREGFQNISHDVLGSVPHKLIEKGVSYGVACKSGTRAAAVTNRLKSLGYMVTNLHETGEV